MGPISINLFDDRKLLASELKRQLPRCSDKDKDEEIKIAGRCSSAYLPLTKPHSTEWVIEAGSRSQRRKIRRYSWHWEGGDKPGRAKSYTATYNVATIYKGSGVRIQRVQRGRSGLRNSNYKRTGSFQTKRDGGGVEAGVLVTCSARLSILSPAIADRRYELVPIRPFQNGLNVIVVFGG